MGRRRWWIVIAVVALFAVDGAPRVVWLDNGDMVVSAKVTCGGAARGERAYIVRKNNVYTAENALLNVPASPSVITALSTAGTQVDVFVASLATAGKISHEGHDR